MEVVGLLGEDADLALEADRPDGRLTQRDACSASCSARPRPGAAQPQRQVAPAQRLLGGVDVTRLQHGVAVERQFEMVSRSLTPKAPSVRRGAQAIRRLQALVRIRPPGCGRELPLPTVTSVGRAAGVRFARG